MGYIRVSTDGQAESGAGLAAQRSAIEAEVARRGLPLIEILEDAGTSAKTLQRPELTRALGMLAAGQASLMVVAKLDRLSRSIADFAGLVRLAERQGWAILAVDLGVDVTTPTGGLLANVTASVAEWERKVISGRTKEALAAKRAAGFGLAVPAFSTLRLLIGSGRCERQAPHVAEVTVVEFGWTPRTRAEDQDRPVGVGMPQRFRSSAMA